MSFDAQALRDEFDNNPVPMPYLALIGDNDVANANIINNDDGANPRTVNNDIVDTGQIRGATTFDAFDGLTASEESWFAWLTQNGVIPVNADTLANLAGIGGTSKWATADRATMEPRMAALMQRVGSRAEEIKDLLGVSLVTPSQVSQARAL